MDKKYFFNKFENLMKNFLKEIALYFFLYKKIFTKECYNLINQPLLFKILPHCCITKENLFKSKCTIFALVQAIKGWMGLLSFLYLSPTLMYAIQYKSLAGLCPASVLLYNLKISIELAVMLLYPKISKENLLSLAATLLQSLFIIYTGYKIQVFTKQQASLAALSPILGIGVVSWLDEKIFEVGTLELLQMGAVGLQLWKLLREQKVGVVSMLSSLYRFSFGIGMLLRTENMMRLGCITAGLIPEVWMFLELRELNKKFQRRRRNILKGPVKISRR